MIETLDCDCKSPTCIICNSVVPPRSDLLSPKRYPVLEQHPHELLFVTISGAHLYGFASPDSDVDLRGCYAASLEQMLGLDELQENISVMDGEQDLATHEVRKYFRMALKSAPYVLEQVMSPLVVVRTRWLEEMRAIIPRLAIKRNMSHYKGFTRKQLALLSRRPYKEVKIVLYVFRAVMSGIYFARTSRVEANIRILNEEFRLPFIDDLIQQKIEGEEHGALIGGHALELYLSESERMLAIMEDEITKSSLPDEIDPQARRELDDLLYRILLGRMNTEFAQAKGV